MKQILLKKLAVAALALCIGPITLLAQSDKEKDKAKDKKSQQIIITRSGDTDEKTVIEINGDKVKVNGKDVADLKDIQVHVNSWNSPNIVRMRSPAQGNYNTTYDNNYTLFSEDANRAMLGVVTDGHDKGVEIQSVTKEGAADKAGLKKGDVITKIDSKTIDATSDVTEAIKAHKPGDKISITYLRDSKEYKDNAELGKWKGVNYKTFTTPQGFDNKVWTENLKSQVFENLYDQRAAVPRVQGNAFSMTTNRTRLGLSVQDTDDGKGVKVLEADEDGNAAKAGIKEDDIITQVDDKAVNSADEISKIMKEKKDQPNVKFQITRGGKAQTIEVKIPRKIKTVDL